MYKNPVFLFELKGEQCYFMEFQSSEFRVSFLCQRFYHLDKLFCMFDEHLEKEGLISHKGTIVDATFVDAPRQRNSRDENKKIKNGEIPGE